MSGSGELRWVFKSSLVLIFSWWKRDFLFSTEQLTSEHMFPDEVFPQLLHGWHCFLLVPSLPEHITSFDNVPHLSQLSGPPDLHTGYVHTEYPTFSYTDTL